MVSSRNRRRAKELAGKYGYLPYMLERYLALWGEEETLRFLEACERPIVTSIRVNTLRKSADDIIPRLEKKGVTLERVPWLEEGFSADFNGLSPGALFEHMMGYYYVQSIPSMTVVDALDPRPGEIIMDLAAAPGGKTTHIAQRMENSGIVVAVESDRKRLASLESNILRCGVDIALVFRGDARKISQLDMTPARILLDAPCSGEGLIARDPSRKVSKSMADIRYCATRQDEMVEAALDILEPGGILVYSTCSVAPEENEFVIDTVLRRRTDVVLLPVEGQYGVRGYTTPYGVRLDESLNLARRFLPHVDGVEGFFICKMRKEG